MTDTTWHALKKVGMDFAETAPTRYEAEAVVAAPRGDVFAAFADAASWKHWFPGVEEASYPGESPPFGVGTFRASVVAGQRYEEYMVAWDEGARWAYYIDRATVPVARAQLEVTEFEDCDGGTRVRWIIACEPLPDLGFMADGTPFEEFMAGLWRDAMQRLEGWLKAG